jgi:hypothetical protein
MRQMDKDKKEKRSKGGRKEKEEKRERERRKGGGGNKNRRTKRRKEGVEETSLPNWSTCYKKASISNINNFQLRKEKHIHWSLK